MKKSKFKKIWHYQAFLDNMVMHNVDPSLMCVLHVEEEHYNLHRLLKMIHLRRSLDNQIVTPRLIFKRHEDLVRELKKRGEKIHKTPMIECIIPDNYLKIEREDLSKLMACEVCSRRIKKENE